MSQKIGVIAKPVDGHLIVASDGSGKSVSGKSLPTKYLDASEVASYSCKRASIIWRKSETAILKPNYKRFFQEKNKRFRPILDRYFFQ